jgi:hypothetical protein
MRNPTSYADRLVDFEKLLAAATANADKLPDLSVLRAPLEQIVTELKGLTTRSDTLVADKQVLVKQRKDALRRGHVQSIALRAAIRGVIGPFEEKLVEFRVTPIRPRGPRSKGNTPQTEPPTQTPPTGTQLPTTAKA